MTLKIHKGSLSYSSFSRNDWKLYLPEPPWTPKPTRPAEPTPK